MTTTAAGTKTGMVSRPIIPEPPDDGLLRPSHATPARKAAVARAREKLRARRDRRRSARGSL